MGFGIEVSGFTARGVTVGKGSVGLYANLKMTCRQDTC